MSAEKKVTKEQLLKAIENLEKNPNNKINILADIGVAGVGAGVAGVAAAVLGATTVVTEIPILFGLITLTSTAIVAAPVAIVAGSAVLGAGAFIGVKKMFFDGTFSDGQRTQMLQQLKDQLKEIEAKERTDKISKKDRNNFIILLKEPIKYNLISPENAQDLIVAVESGRIPITEAIKMVQDLINRG